MSGVSLIADSCECVSSIIVLEDFEAWFEFILPSCFSESPTISLPQIPELTALPYGLSKKLTLRSFLWPLRFLIVSVHTGFCNCLTFNIIPFQLLCGLHLMETDTKLKAQLGHKRYGLPQKENWWVLSSLKFYERSDIVMQIRHSYR